MTLDEFETAYTRSWRAKLDGLGDESDRAFAQAKAAAVRALQEGATPDQLAESMRRCRPDRATDGR